MSLECIVAQSCQAFPRCEGVCCYSLAESPPLTARQIAEEIDYWQHMREIFAEGDEDEDTETRAARFAALEEAEEELARLTGELTR